MDSEEPTLFDVSDLSSATHVKKFRCSDGPPLWTRNKAQFIARYLKTFTFVTKHGTYIDAFAGPQHHETSDVSWSAKLVMETEPKWLRNFHLFELDEQKVLKLQELKELYLTSAPDISKRSISVSAGDCNLMLPKFLQENPIKEKEASFCLFDQRSTECDWETVKCVANHKGSNGGNKIEIFYFLAQGWIDRAIKSWKIDVEERCERWWGNSDCLEFLKLGSHDRGRLMAERFKNELGYSYAYSFPIQQDGIQGRIMFWMVHASDHPRASDLMWQAYRHIGAGGGLNDPIDQLKLNI